jgi:NADH:ubiquinone oxidoreductase subunit 6 (subunit J)
LLAGATLSYISCHKEIHFSKISNFFDRHKILVSNIFSFLGCGLLLIGFLLISKKSSFPGSWALVPVLGAVFISILFAWLSFRFVEKPIRAGAKNKSIIWILISLMLLLGALGFITSKKDGFEFRQKESVKAVNRIIDKATHRSDISHLIFIDRHAERYSMIILVN